MGEQREKKEGGYRDIAALLAENSEKEPKQGLIIIKDKRIVTSSFSAWPNSAIDVLRNHIGENPRLREDITGGVVYFHGEVSNDDLEWIAGESILKFIQDK